MKQMINASTQPLYSLERALVCIEQQARGAPGLV